MLIISQVSTKEQLENQFEGSFNELEFAPNYRIERGDEAFIVTTGNHCNFTRFNYGMVPFWTRQRIIHYEAPVEGDVAFPSEVDQLKMRIIQTPTFRRPIRETRCLIPSDYFIIPSSLGEVYLFFPNESKPFALAGVYDSWKANYLDEEFYNGFSILTTPSSPFLQSIGIERLPLVISHGCYKNWLNPESCLTEITDLMHPLSEKVLNAYPIHRNAFSTGLNSRELCRTAGDTLFKTEEQEKGKLSTMLRSFWNKRGVSPIHNNLEEKIWKG
jgi:putative SOS response-associated peptidase YedK